MTKGIGPLIMSFCIELPSYKTNTLVQNAYSQFVNGNNEHLRKFGNSLAVSDTLIYHDVIFG